jgi:general L-amino acid transport system substrate-binding protein
MKRTLLRLTAALALAAGFAAPAGADTIKMIRDRGKIICGTSHGVAGFSTAGRQWPLAAASTSTSAGRSPR